MKAYDVWFKKTAVARKVYIWTRFADSKEAATESAEKALNDEYFGSAELLDVVEQVNN